MHMLKKSLVAMLAALMLAGAALAATATAAPKPTANVAVPVTGTFTDALGGTGTFTGTYTVNRVGQSGGALAAVGTVTGTAVDSLGTPLGTATQAVTVPLQAAGTCDILHLTLGPLDLDLLGLVIHLDQVVLDITAEQGPGNLLGNLLCAVAGLLDPPTGGGGGGLSGLLQSIIGLLNQILGQL
jgi:hypothetical protein